MTSPRSNPMPAATPLTERPVMPTAATGGARLALELYSAFNDRNFDRGSAVVAPEFELEAMPTGELFRGPEGYRAFAGIWAAAFPDSRVEIRTIVSEGEYLCVEFTGRGTHTGTLATSMGDIPATGRSMTLQLCDVMEFKNGKVQSQKTYFDTGSMMAQLGLTADQMASQQ